MSQRGGSRGNAFGNSSRSRNSHSNDSHVHQEQTEHLFEQQNNELVDSLYDKVDLLKKITIDIGNEVREQNKFLDGLDMEMESTGNIFGGTMKKLNEMINFGGGGHMLKLSLFIFCLFIIVYYMVR